MPYFRGEALQHFAHGGDIRFRAAGKYQHLALRNLGAAAGHFGFNVADPKRSQNLGVCNHLLRSGGRRVDDNLPRAQVRLEFCEHGVDDLAVGQTQQDDVAPLH